MSPAPFESDVSSKFGAPMGRQSDIPANLNGRVHLRRIPAVGHDYDPGGAYWGDVSGRCGSAVWCAWDAEGSVVYLRARSRVEATKYLREEGFEGTFYRGK